MTRFHQGLLIGSTLVLSWIGMQMIHELGHVFGAALTGGDVKKVVLNPLTISRTDLGSNPHPLFVAWAGPILGTTVPLAAWGVASTVHLAGAFVVRFFAGFCSIANGAYIGFGSFRGFGDCGELLTHGAPMWQLWLFGAVTIPIGLSLWHGQGTNFGLSSAGGHVSAGVTYGAFTVSIVLLLIGVWVGGD